MKPLQIRRAVYSKFEQEGFERAGRVLRAESPELVWLVDPKTSIRGGRVVVNVGCVVRTVQTEIPATATDCWLRIGLDAMPFVKDVPAGPRELARCTGFKSVIRTLFQEDVAIDDDDRVAAIDEFLSPLVELVLTTRSIPDLVTLYQEGWFRAAAIHREVRAVLESSLDAAT